MRPTAAILASCSRAFGVVACWLRTSTTHRESQRGARQAASGNLVGQRRFRGATVGGGRPAPRQHRPLRIQARPARPRLPQVRLRRLRGTPGRPANGSRGGPRRRSRRPRGVRRQGGLLAAAGRALVLPARQRPQAGNRRTGRCRHEGDRGQQPQAAPRRAAARLRPAGAGQVAAGPGHRPALQRRRRRHAAPGERHAGAGLRVLPGHVRQRRGPPRRRLLHAALRGPPAGRDAGAAREHAHLRPLLRLGRHVRAERAVHRDARRPAAVGVGLRPGVQPHDVAAVQDEPGHPRHRGRRPRGGHLRRRPPPGPEGRLRAGQSALQHERVGRPGAARGPALAVRHAAGRQRQLRLDPALHLTTSGRTASPAS